MMNDTQKSMMDGTQLVVENGMCTQNIYAKKVKFTFQNANV